MNNAGWRAAAASTRPDRRPGRSTVRSTAPSSFPDIDFEITGDSRRVLYEASTVPDAEVDLWSVAIDGSSPPVRLNPPLLADESIRDYLLTEDGQQVVIELERPGTDALLRVAIDGAGGATTLDEGDVDRCLPLPGDERQSAPALLHRHRRQRPARDPDDLPRLAVPVSTLGGTASDRDAHQLGRDHSGRSPGRGHGRHRRRGCARDLVDPLRQQQHSSQAQPGSPERRLRRAFRALERRPRRLRRRRRGQRPVRALERSHRRQRGTDQALGDARLRRRRRELPRRRRVGGLPRRRGRRRPVRALERAGRRPRSAHPAVRHRASRPRRFELPLHAVGHPSRLPRQPRSGQPVGPPHDDGVRLHQPRPG